MKSHRKDCSHVPSLDSAHVTMTTASCPHRHVSCLNQFETIRKYRCADCDGVFMCACDRDWALAFLPHQTRAASESGTRERIPLSGFAPGICSECRGEPPQRNPVAAIYGRKGKVERFYWREIRRDSYLAMLAFLNERGESVADVLEFNKRFPGVEDQFTREAKKAWQSRHRQAPKYDTREQTEAAFLARVAVPTRQVVADYVQVSDRGRTVGKWRDGHGQLVSAENVVAASLRTEGYEVLPCERALISAWVATFLAAVVQDPSDPQQQTVMRGSTRNWTRARAATPITFPLPSDFGTAQYYVRRQAAFEQALHALSESPDLVEEFDRRAEGAETLRDYLWVADDGAQELARSALAVMPREVVVSSLKWAISSFWSRQPGWPDLFAWREREYLFCEAKSPHDELSLEQMQWFEWAVQDAGVPCSIARVKPKSVDDRDG